MCTIKFDENGGRSQKGPYLLMSLMDGPEGRKKVQCALVHANLRERESATGPTNLNLNGFVGARAEQSSTFLAAALPPAIPCEASPIPIQFQRENCSGRRQGAVGLAFYFEAGRRAQATEATYHLLSASRHANNGPIQLGIVASGRHDA